MKPKLYAFGSADLSLAELCPASAVVGPMVRETPHPGMWWGVFVHRFLEYAKSRGRAHAIAYIERKYPRALRCCRGIDLAQIPDGEPEVAMAFDPAVPSVRRYVYPDHALPTEVHGKADLLVRDVVHVLDYKTGGRTFDPRESTQIVGLAVSRRLELQQHDGAEVSVVGVCADGQLLWRTERLSRAELDDQQGRLARGHLAVLRSRQAYAEGEEPEYRAGPHCEAEYCSFRHECPARRS